MKRYLTGIDWIVNTIDYTGKAQSGIGNHSELILELKNPPNHQALEEALNNFNRNLPLLNGFPSRAINLCPYWKIPPGKKSLPIRINIIKFNDPIDYLLVLAKPVNTAFKERREHLAFTLLETNKLTFLSMAFDHRILDAKGAEAFLNLFQQYYENHRPLQIPLDCPPHLNSWKEKFLAGRQINRFFLNLARHRPRTLPFNPQNEPCRFKVIHLSYEQSVRLANLAYARAGYLMFMPYALAVSIQIMHKIFQEKNIPGLNYLIPVPIDTRTKEKAQQETLFNHFSFLIFNISADKVSNLNWLLAEIKNQMYEQVKNGIPAAILNASFLIRIASLPLTNFFLKLISKKHFASFSFSYLNNAYQQNKLMQTEVQNIFHLPRTPKPPGIGIFINQFESKFNITLSYFDDLLNDTQVNQIIKSLEALGNEESANSL